MEIKVGKLYQRVFPSGYRHKDDVVMISKIKNDTVWFYYINDHELQTCWSLFEFENWMIEWNTNEQQLSYNYS